jgi:hypothetical protein
MNERIKTEWLGLGRLYGAGLRAYFGNFGTIAGIVACVYIPVYLLVAVAVLTIQDGQLLNSVESGVSGLGGALALGAIAYATERRVLGQASTLGAALRYGYSRWGSVLVTSIAVGLIFLVPILLAVVIVAVFTLLGPRAQGLPGAILCVGLPLLLGIGAMIPIAKFLVRYAFAMMAAALRDMRYSEALGYSKELVVDRAWKVLGILLAIGTPSVIVAYFFPTALLFGIGIVVAIGYALAGQELTVLPLGVQAFTVLAAGPLSALLGAFFTVVSILFFLNLDYLQEATLADTALRPVGPLAHEDRTEDGGIAVTVPGLNREQVLELSTLLRSGCRLEAVGHVRQYTGLGPAEAIELLDRLATGTDEKGQEAPG